MKKLVVCLLALTLLLGSFATEAFAETAKVTMALLLPTGAPADTQLVQDAINDITRETIGVEVELQISDISSYQQNLTLALAGGETIDIASAIFCFGNLVQQGYLMNLEENDLLKTYGQGIIDAVGMEYINACRVNGVLYGVANNRDMAQGRGGVAIATKYLEGIGYEFDPSAEIIKTTQTDIDEIFAQIHEKYPDIEVFRPLMQSMQTFCTFDQIGGNSFGVLLDYGKATKVENLFTSSDYMDYCARMYDYNQKGYISQDAVVDTTGVGELVAADKLAAYIAAGKPGIKTQESGKCKTDMTIFQVYDDFVSSSAVTNFPWTITINTADPVASMKFLNECYTNPAVANLLSWGIEGKHYTVLDNGLAAFPDGVDAASSGYYHTFQWALPNQYITHAWNGNAVDVWDKVRAFNENSHKSSALGFSFDTTNVQTEIVALQNVYSEYQASLEFGMVDPSTGVAEMNEKMLAAGLQNVIDEKQAQLDAWVAVNK